MRAGRLTPIDLQGPAGRLEAILKLPAGPPRLAAAVAHPHPLYGGTMHDRVVYAAARRLEAHGAAVLRFNFRGVGTSMGSHDHGRGERLDMTAALAALRERLPGLPLIAAGYSFGSFVALAAGAGGRADALLGLAPPVGYYDFSFLHASPVPLAVVSGEEDPIAPPDGLTREARGWKGLVHWEALPGAAHDLGAGAAPFDQAVDRALGRLLAVYSSGAQAS